MHSYARLLLVLLAALRVRDCIMLCKVSPGVRRLVRLACTKAEEDHVAQLATCAVLVAVIAGGERKHHHALRKITRYWYVVF